MKNAIVSWYAYAESGAACLIRRPSIKVIVKQPDCQDVQGIEEKT